MSAQRRSKMLVIFSCGSHITSAGTEKTFMSYAFHALA
ncbi:hypothetical protein RA11412_1378 [Rothia aeria]|uniref:Uncharacterized protein n=1 Tax=Rothia aeria TaxID=172042 RepID=A0A2Z5QZ10_9MICC|nr:hypothetical protein RA11412_1378 [Rothia aeria]